ncbi:MAG: hypothetical protein RSD99_15925, partial [Janthinobacterium sp.]
SSEPRERRRRGEVMGVVREVKKVQRATLLPIVSIAAKVMNRYLPGGMGAYRAGAAWPIS